MKLAIVGSRDFRNYKQMKDLLATIEELPNVTTIVSGGAGGADTLAALFAKETERSLEVHPADWDQHGKRAGILRNRKIVESADYVVAFWDGRSTGTKSTIAIAEEMGKPVEVFYVLRKTIVFDYDGTLSTFADILVPAMRAFIEAGHNVIICTMRYPHEEDTALRFYKTQLRVPIYYTSRKAKKTHLMRKGLSPDLYIEDRPEYLFNDA